MDKLIKMIHSELDGYHQDLLKKIKNHGEILILDNNKNYASVLPMLEEIINRLMLETKQSIEENIKTLDFLC